MGIVVPSGVDTINSNRAAMPGYSDEPMRTVSNDAFFNLLHPDDRDAARACERDLENGNDKSEIAHRLPHRSETWISVLSKGGVVARDRLVRPTAFCGVLIDITAQTEREGAFDAARIELDRAIKERENAGKRFFDIAAISKDWFRKQDAELRFAYFSENAGLAGGNLLLTIGKT